jgi:cobalt-zinc-cadmium efflux system protein
MSGTHDHDHALPANSPRQPLAIVLGIPSTILVVEVVGAYLSGSLALLAEAGHMITDVAGLSLALVAAVLAGRPATDARTWGYRRSEVLAAAAQAAVLLAVVGFVLVEGVRRLVDPPTVSSGVMWSSVWWAWSGTGLDPVVESALRRQPQHQGRVARSRQRGPWRCGGPARQRRGR